MEYVYAFTDLLNEMSPYLLLGFFIAGLLHVYVPRKVYSDYLSGNNFRSVLWSALFGIPLPLCSCGVIPTAMSLRKEGASKGATASFLIATPQTGVDSIMATYSLMGLPFAIVRPIAALVTALFGGVLVNKFGGESSVTPVAAEDGGCGCGNCDEDGKKLGFVDALEYGFVEMLQDIGKWLIIGLAVAGLITIFVPSTFFTDYADTPWKCMILVMLISMPMYLCATGSIPIAVALMMKGLSPGAALLLLMAGPATNMASMLVVRKVMGLRTLLIYLASIILGAVVFGLCIDYLLPADMFVAGLKHASAHCAGTAFPWFKTLCSVVLVCLLINAFFFSRHSGAHSHNHETNNLSVMEKKYKVSGMTCNHCKASVEKNLLKLEGVTFVEASLSDGTVVVSGNADEQKVKEVVEELGFSYGGMC